MYSWGRGTFGRLGTGSEGDELVPVRVKFDFKEQEKLNIVGISAGAYHSLALAGQFLQYLLAVCCTFGCPSN